MYATDYHSAGVIREDDYERGLIGFYDTYDYGQGGDSFRASLAADLEKTTGDTLFGQQVFAIKRTMRLREDFTGYLLDVQEPWQTPHPQRATSSTSTSTRPPSARVDLRACRAEPSDRRNSSSSATSRATTRWEAPSSDSHRPHSRVSHGHQSRIEPRRCRTVWGHQPAPRGLDRAAWRTARRRLRIRCE